MSESSSALLSQLKLGEHHREDNGENRRFYLFGILFIVILVAGYLGYRFLSGGNAIAVEAATVVAAQQSVANTSVLDAAGYVTARRMATVSSKITGKLEEVLIEEGDRVEAGQVLARLENTEQVARVNLSLSQIDAAETALNQLRIELAQAQRDLQRQRELIARELVSQQQLENSETTAALLQARIASQQKQIDVSRAELALANVDLDNTVVRAPFGGVIIAKAAQPGEIVSPAAAGGGNTRTGIGTIVDMDSLEVEVDVNEAFINRVTPGQRVEAVLDAYPNWKIPSEVIAIIPAADRAKATVRVRIALLEKDNRIVPDMGVRVSFFEDQPAEPSARVTGVLVPGSAITERNGRSVVFLIDGETAREQTVVPGQAYGELRLLEEGLAAGTRIVREPPAELIDGARIELESVQ